MPESRASRVASPLSIRVEEHDSVAARLVLGGELDLSNCGELNAEIDTLQARNLERIVVDLSELRFIDSSGLACFVHLAQRNLDEPTELLFIRGPRAVERVFRISGLTDILPFDD